MKGRTRLAFGLPMRGRMWLAFGLLNVAVAAAVAGADAAFDVGPPGEAGANGVWAVLFAVALTAAGGAAGRAVSGLATPASLAAAALAAGLIAAAAYQALAAKVVWDAPDGSRIVTGADLTDAARAMKDVMGWGDEELRQNAPNYDMRVLYTADSLGRAAAALQFRWLATVVAVLAALAAAEWLLVAARPGPARKWFLSFQEKPMPIDGVTFEEICTALEEAYGRNDMEDMLKKRMSERLGKMTGPNSDDKKMVFDVVTWTENRGRTTELIRAGYAYNPAHPLMKALYEKYGMAADVDLQRGGAAAGTVKQTGAGLEKTVKDRLPQLDFAKWLRDMAAVEGRVCRVEIDGRPAGTGFLVGPEAVLTNYHVLESVLTGATGSGRVACRFDYKMSANNTRLEGTAVGLHPSDWRLDASPPSAAERAGRPDDPPPTADELDYALVRLSRDAGADPVGPTAAARGWLSLPAAAAALAAGDPILIAQHPDGCPLKLALDTDSVIGPAGGGRRVRYATNTEPGSSGSPVFDLQWNPVALHHLGDPASALPPKYNQGVPLDLIRARIAKTTAAAAALGR